MDRQWETKGVYATQISDAQNKILQRLWGSYVDLLVVIRGMASEVEYRVSR